MEKINDVIKDVLINLGYKNLYYAGILKKNWKNIVGDLIASVSNPDRIERETLYIKCSNPAWKQELYFFKEEIIEKINLFFKDFEIKDIKIYFKR